MRVKRMISAVDAYAAGEPGRVIIGGVIDVPGETMFEKMRYFEEHHDHLRKLMLREPRGYPALCCNILMPPTHPAADAGFIIMEQTEYPAMSGTNTICVATVLLETGMLPMQEPVTELTLEAPAGLIKIRAEVEGGKVKQVTFQNVPSFAFHIGAEIEVPTLGEVKVDVAYGGMIYVLAEAYPLGVKLDPGNARQIARVGQMLKTAANEQLEAVHPENPDIAGVSITLLSGPATHDDADARNTVVVSAGDLDWDRPDTWTGALDRSPCGTGTCARMAVMHAQGELPLNQDFRHEGILDTIFTGRLIEETKVGDYPAVVPTLSGTAWITGVSTYMLDPDDPFPEGFTLGDIWP
jgi:proline racemase